VERHLTAIYGALGVDRRSAAVARAAAAGLLKPPSL
jgi:ATP/maltotriose-dependent transcriptional regulator MalT